MAGKDDEMFMTRSFNVTPKTTEQLLIARSDKSVAYITNNKRLRSTFCTIEANYWETRNIARPLCDSRATCFLLLSIRFLLNIFLIGKTLRGHMVPPPLHVRNGLARPPAQENGTDIETTGHRENKIAPCPWRSVRGYNKLKLVNSRATVIGTRFVCHILRHIHLSKHRYWRYLKHIDLSNSQDQGRWWDTWGPA